MGIMGIMGVVGVMGVVGIMGIMGLMGVGGVLVRVMKLWQFDTNFAKLGALCEHFLVGGCYVDVSVMKIRVNIST